MVRNLFAPILILIGLCNFRSNQEKIKIIRRLQLWYEMKEASLLRPLYRWAVASEYKKFFDIELLPSDLSLLPRKIPSGKTWYTAGFSVPIPGVEATIMVNSTSVSCIVPTKNFNESVSVTLELSKNGVAYFFTYPLIFFYHILPHLTVLYPITVSEAGGNYVKILGTGLVHHSPNTAA